MLFACIRQTTLYYEKFRQFKPGLKWHESPTNMAWNNLNATLSHSDTLSPGFEYAQNLDKINGTRKLTSSASASTVGDKFYEFYEWMGKKQKAKKDKKD